MRWGTNGAQAILTTRGGDRSERFDEARALVAATYQCDVRALANVLEITAKPHKKQPPRTSR
jgi:hypothetical protein